MEGVREGRPWDSEGEFLGGSLREGGRDSGDMEQGGSYRGW
jgi:hypothetical protein